MRTFADNKYRVCHALGSVCMFLTLAACYATPEKSTDVPEIELALSFQAKWWSEDQMEGLDLDNPPEKQFPVELESWEASDPVSTPHPHSFDVIATVQTSASIENLTLHTMQRWGVGRLSDNKPTRWTPWTSIDPGLTLTTSASRRHTVRVTGVDLDSVQQELYSKGQWPWAYAVRIEATDQYENGNLRAQVSKQLPILAAD